MSPKIFKRQSPKVPFTGFLRTPEASPGDVSVVGSPLYMTRYSPSKHVVNGRSLSDFKGAIIDLCSLTVSLIQMSNRPSSVLLETFKELLRLENIPFYSLPETDPFHKHTIRLVDAEAARRLYCKFPDGKQSITGALNR